MKARLWLMYMPDYGIPYNKNAAAKEASRGNLLPESEILLRVAKLEDRSITRRDINDLAHCGGPSFVCKNDMIYTAFYRSDAAIKDDVAKRLKEYWPTIEPRLP